MAQPGRFYNYHPPSCEESQANHLETSNPSQTFSNFLKPLETSSEDPKLNFRAIPSPFGRTNLETGGKTPLGKMGENLL